MISRSRRFSIAVLSIALATVLLHERCADVLVTKADGQLAAGLIHAVPSPTSVSFSAIWKTVAKHIYSRG